MDLRMDPPYEEVVDSFFTWEKEAGKVGETGEEEAGGEGAAATATASGC